MNKNDIIREELAAKEMAENNTNIEVKMYTKECIDYKTTHKNCHGCQYEKACSKTVGLLLATFSRNPWGKIDEVLASDTPAEIDFDFDESQDLEEMNDN